MLRKMKKSSLRRHTWPRAEVERLETIPESPRTPQEAHFSAASQSTSRKPESSQATLLSRNRDCITAKTDATLPDAIRTQMIWYSHHLTQSYQDRERLSNRIKELETVCKSQSETNASLLLDTRSWQHNYESIEEELLEATQEIEEMKLCVKNLETANTNLRDTLSQAKVMQERARQQKLRGYLTRCWRTCTILPSKAIHACWGLGRRIRQENASKGNIPASSASSLRMPSESLIAVNVSREGARSRLSGCLPQESLCSSSLSLSEKSEKVA